MRRPIYDTLVKYSAQSPYPWHMPGHKRWLANKSETSEHTPRGDVWKDIYAMDFTEIPGLDEYHCPEGIIKEAQEQAANIYGTKNSYFLVNGSTVGILAAMSAVCKRQDEVLVARNCHRSVYNAMELFALSPVYMQPEWLTEWNLYGGISPVLVEQLLEKHPGVRAVILTSPTYEGIISDISAIAQVVHWHQAVLIVDEAHGAHLPFFEDGPDSAIHQGADLVIQSLHKTLPAMTQTAILHRCSELVDEERLFHYISAYQSTSPSYVMLASIDYAIHFMAEETRRLQDYKAALHAFRDRAAAFTNIRLLEWKHITGSCAKGYDDDKLVLSAADGYRTKYGGVWLSEQLSRRGQQVEMAGCTYSLCMSTVMDTAEAFHMLADALEEIDRILPETETQAADFKEIRITDYALLDDNIISDIASALMEEKIWLPMCRCPGRVAGAYVYAYPPGSPLLVPGERITKEVISLITGYKQAGLNMKGIKDGQLCVLKKH